MIRSEQGTAYSVGAVYLFAQGIGTGKLQPFVRFQNFSPDTHIDTRQGDAGVNYLIDGYNAQVGAAYSCTKVTARADQSKLVIVIVMQLQY